MDIRTIVEQLSSVELHTLAHTVGALAYDHTSTLSHDATVEYFRYAAELWGSAINSFYDGFEAAQSESLATLAESFHGKIA